MIRISNLAWICKLIFAVYSFVWHIQIFLDHKSTQWEYCVISGVVFLKLKLQKGEILLKDKSRDGCKKYYWPRNKLLFKNPQFLPNPYESLCVGTNAWISAWLGKDCGSL